jgi:hypothetical protein
MGHSVLIILLPSYPPTKRRIFATNPQFTVALKPHIVIANPFTMNKLYLGV